MNNKTQPTPELLAKIREEFESLYTGKCTLERYPDGYYKIARIQWTKLATNAPSKRASKL